MDGWTEGRTKEVRGKRKEFPRKREWKFGSKGEEAFVRKGRSSEESSE